MMTAQLIAQDPGVRRRLAAMMGTERVVLRRAKSESKARRFAERMELEKTALDKIAAGLVKGTSLLVADICGPRKTAPIVQLRWKLYHGARTAGISFCAIGRFVGRHYSGVIHAMNRIDD